MSCIDAPISLLESADLLPCTGPDTSAVPPVQFSTLLHTGLLHDMLCLYNAEQQQFHTLITLGANVCGHPRITHGGMTAAIIDETLGGLNYVLKREGIVPHGPSFTVHLEVQQNPILCLQSCLHLFRQGKHAMASVRILGHARKHNELNLFQQGFSGGLERVSGGLQGAGAGGDITGVHSQPAVAGRAQGLGPGGGPGPARRHAVRHRQSPLRDPQGQGASALLRHWQPVLHSAGFMTCSSCMLRGMRRAGH